MGVDHPVEAKYAGYYKNKVGEGLNTSLHESLLPICLVKNYPKAFITPKNTKSIGLNFFMPRCRVGTGCWSSSQLENLLD